MYNDTMNIYTQPGRKVTVTENTIRNGFDHDPAKKLLVVGEIYTVKKIDVVGWSSKVYLEELDGGFDTVLFINK